MAIQACEEANEATKEAQISQGALQILCTSIEGTGAAARSRRCGPRDRASNESDFEAGAVKIVGQISEPGRLIQGIDHFSEEVSLDK